MCCLFASLSEVDFGGERRKGIPRWSPCWWMRKRGAFQSDRTRSRPSVRSSICRSAEKAKEKRRVFLVKSSDSSLASTYVCVCVCVCDERMACCYTQTHVNVVRKKEKQNKTPSDGKKHNRDAKRTTRRTTRERESMRFTTQRRRRTKRRTYLLQLKYVSALDSIKV